MLRLLKVVLVLAVLCAAGLVGFAYLGDMDPGTREVTAPVAIDVD